jgi:hypothetical protein
MSFARTVGQMVKASGAIRRAASRSARLLSSTV